MFAEANNGIVTLWAQFSWALKFDFCVDKFLVFNVKAIKIQQNLIFTENILS